MADETQTFALALEDGISPVSQDAARALEQLKAKIEGDTRALRSMQQAMARLKAGGLGTTDQFKRLRDQVAAQRAVIGQAQAKYISLGGTFDALSKNAAGASGGLAELLGAAQATPGPLGAIAGRLGALRGLFAAGPVLGFAAAMLVVVAASAALVGAVGAATAALLRYGIAQAGARRSELLRLEGLTRVRSMYGLAAGNASEMQAAIDRVSDATATGRGEIAGYAEQLYRAGLRGGALEEALDGMAIAGSAGGDRLARRFAGLAVGAARMGRSVRGVADDFRSRFGGIAARQALSLDRQMTRLHENISALFGDLNIESFLRALRTVTSLFSQSTASGRALKRIVEVLFQPMIDGIARSGPVVRRFFQGMIIGAQRLTILYLRVRNALMRAFGARDVLGGIDTQTLAVRAGTVVIAGFAAAVLTAVVVLGGLAAVLAVVAAGVLVMTAPILAAVAALGMLASAGARYGSQLMEGLVTGISKGRDRVLEAVRSIGSDATRALRNVLQIRSPSRVFAQLGLQIPAGLAEGVEAGSSSAAGAVEGMVAAPNLPGASGARGGSRVSVSIGDVIVQVGESAQPREIGRAIVDELVQAFEGVGIELGIGAT